MFAGIIYHQTFDWYKAHQMFYLSSCNCLCWTHCSQVENEKWNGVDRRCSNYIWVINNFIAHSGVAYISGLTLCKCVMHVMWFSLRCNRTTNYSEGVNYFNHRVQHGKTTITDLPLKSFHTMSNINKRTVYRGKSKWSITKNVIFMTTLWHENALHIAVHLHECYGKWMNPYLVWFEFYS